MAVPTYLLDVVKEQESLTMAIADDRVTFFAKRVAFYEAMLEASIDDPFDDPIDQAEMSAHLRNKKTEALTAYMNLVNEAL